MCHHGNICVCDVMVTLLSVHAPSIFSKCLLVKMVNTVSWANAFEVGEVVPKLLDG